MYNVGIITCSDKAYKGLRLDESGKVIEKVAKENGFNVSRYTILPDEKEKIADELKHMSDELKLNVIFTTGGTGFSKRDVTPEATKEVIERETPGIPEAMRGYSLTITKRAMLSRAVAGIRGESLIINLPGSPKGVKESLDVIISSITHGLDIITGKANECASK
ncbi:MogA/MoaB family molybdenum cofactor biosynthesis protein [Clostridium paridis]|uniref:MogA/MoaB family molybdenum cofactor biosynthesis protein n=1 Tax=Clostridium paridis TaxID=2803863 RepID=A0A937K4G4_9CLOT|nr:MogA/MoaB family molybdenum cofactor biosynthesis protein [Clostridium paridis]MBL4933311.1 MogA/MoaB family molybdenum cofactor biosynthesis protein [Clostridium paridis]